MLLFRLSEEANAIIVSVRGNLVEGANRGVHLSPVAGLSAYGRRWADGRRCRCSKHLRVVQGQTGLSFPITIFQPMKRIPASPSSLRNPQETESRRDVPPDRSSGAREGAGLPPGGSHSVQGKRSLPVPNKVGQPGPRAGAAWEQGEARGSFVCHVARL